jgi:hypothetical protein
MKQTLASTFALALLLGLAFLAVPADVEAQSCRSTFLGCGFSHIECDSGACCCVYQCSDGSFIHGLCWQTLLFTAEAPTSLLDQLLAMEPAVETEEAPAAVEEPAEEPVAEACRGVAPHPSSSPRPPSPRVRGEGGVCGSVPQSS